MLYTFLLVVHAIIAAILVAIILMQRSEGGGLGVGGSPAGVMSARGAADFLTRGTAILATLFVLMSIGLAALATIERAPRDIDTSLARNPAAAPATVPASDVPLADPLAPGAAGLPPTTGAPAAPATAQAPAVPAAQPVPAETSNRTPRAEPVRRERAPETKAEPKAAPAPAPRAEPKAAPAPTPSTPLVLPPKAADPSPAPAPAAENSAQ